MDDCVSLVFHGRLAPASFAAFARHRAGRLALRHVFGAVEPDRVEVTVSGAADLIDAFEVACSLGPLDCVVLHTHRGGTCP